MSCYYSISLAVSGGVYILLTGKIRVSSTYPGISLIIVRVMSICLGRPFAARDEDCRCSLPANLRDEEYLTFIANQSEPSNPSTSKEIEEMPLTGFLAFARLCRIAGMCESLNSPSRIRILASSDTSKVRRYVARARKCEKVLEKWLASLSDEFRFSANAVDTDYSQTPELTMCVIAFIMHAGLLLNLYR